MVGPQKTLSQKRRGRPPTGTGELIGVRLQPDQLGALDKWIARHPDPKPSRPEAIRRDGDRAPRGGATVAIAARSAERPALHQSPEPERRERRVNWSSRSNARAVPDLREPV